MIGVDLQSGGVIKGRYVDIEDSVEKFQGISLSLTSISLFLIRLHKITAEKTD